MNWPLDFYDLMLLNSKDLISVQRKLVDISFIIVVFMIDSSYRKLFLISLNSENGKLWEISNLSHQINLHSKSFVSFVSQAGCLKFVNKILCSAQMSGFKVEICNSAVLRGVIKATRVDKPTRNNVASKEEWKGVSKARQVYEEWLEIEKTEKG